MVRSTARSRLPAKQISSRITIWDLSYEGMPLRFEVQLNGAAPM